MDYMQSFIKEIAEKKLNKEEIHKRKLQIARELKLKSIPSDIELYLNAPKELIPKLSQLQTKPIRSASGVTQIALMTKPIPCPHGKCTYCPGGVNSAFGDTPQSYTGFEPSTMRGKRADFDSYLITMNRLEQFIALGHSPEKVDAIIQGGTFPAFPKKYQKEYIRDFYYALNRFSEMFYERGELDIMKFKDFFELPGDIKNVDRTARIKEKLLAIKKPKSLAYEMKKNVTST